MWIKINIVIYLKPEIRSYEIKIVVHDKPLLHFICVILHILFSVDKYVLYLTSSVKQRGRYINAITVSVSASVNNKM